MINSDLTTYAAKWLAGITLAMIGLGLFVLAGCWEVEAESHVERDYCERVAAGVHRAYNENIDCRIIL